VTSEHLWCGRHVKVIDGSTVSMPDTPLNQKAYPQPSSQAPGCSFPIAKIGALFSLATGAAVALVINVSNTHDIKLARQIYQFLNPGDVLLGDCAFCSYADIDPLRLSLQGTRQLLDNFVLQLASASTQKRARLYQTLLKTIAHKLVPECPRRCKPRVRKRRPKSYPLMRKPRQVLRQECLAEERFSLT